MMVSCALCKEDLALYQKKGKGNLLHMHLDRILQASFPFDKELVCPACKQVLGVKVSLQKEQAYAMKRSHFNTRTL